MLKRFGGIKMKLMIGKKKINLRMKNIIGIICILTLIVTIVFVAYKRFERHQMLDKLEIVNDVSKIELFEKEQYILKANLNNKDFVKELKWTTSDDNILKIDNEGKMTAIKEGIVKVYSKVKGCNNKGETTVVVKPLVNLKNIKISGIDVNNVSVGDKIPLKIQLEPKNVSYNKLSFKSSDDKVAQVDENGIINTLTTGKVTITVGCENSDKTESLEFTVKEKRLQKITFKEGKKITLENGESHKLVPQFIPKESKKSDLVYSSSNKTIASVSSDGTITTLRPGIVTITLKSTEENKSASIDVIVKSDNGLISKKDLDSLGLDGFTKLMIVAHPDDETLWGGGHLLEGNWFVVCLTNGYNSKRVTEFTNALSVSGSKFMILNYPDYKVKRIIDDWKYVKKGIGKDIELLLKYKNWKQVATHNLQGEYGHKHHKMTNQIVTAQARNYNTIDKLYYFGKFYKPNEVPVSLKPNIENKVLETKMKMIDQYPNQRKSIDALWIQMAPHEHWTKAA